MAISPKAGQQDLFADLEKEQKERSGEMVSKDAPEETKTKQRRESVTLTKKQQAEFQKHLDQVTHL